MKTISSLILITWFLSSCNFKLCVSEDQIKFQESGHLLIIGDTALFITSKDSTFNTMKLRNLKSKAYLMNDLSSKELQALKGASKEYSIAHYNSSNGELSSVKGVYVEISGFPKIDASANRNEAFFFSIESKINSVRLISFDYDIQYIHFYNDSSLKIYKSIINMD